MSNSRAAESIAVIEAARRPGDVFSGTPSDTADRRAARRRHRILLAAVHPDHAATEGISPEIANDATMTLNALYRGFLDGAEATVPTAPHVRGTNGTYVLGERIWATDTVVAYLTDNPLVRVEITRQADARESVGTLRAATATLADNGMSAFAPRVVDHAATDGREWVAYRIPEDTVALSAIHAARPDGLDGRDWAWMARRIVMTLVAAGQPHGNLTPETVLIHPEQHGVVLTGWGSRPTDAGPDAAPVDGTALSRLFTAMLASRAARQRRFAALSTTLPLHDWLREYDLLLGTLYGPRRFRPFITPTTERT